MLGCNQWKCHCILSVVLATCICITLSKAQWMRVPLARLIEFLAAAPRALWGVTITFLPGVMSNVPNVSTVLLVLVYDLDMALSTDSN